MEVFLRLIEINRQIFDKKCRFMDILTNNVVITAVNGQYTCR